MTSSLSVGDKMPDDSPNNFASFVNLDIVEKRMKVFLVVKETIAEQTFPITTQDLLSLLETAGIKFGINHAALEEIINEKKWGSRILVAEGLSPIPGKEAALEFNFSTDISLKPQIAEDGHVNFHEICVVNSVEKDAVLIKKVPASLGTPGKDTFGTEIAASYGKDVSIIMGSGTYKDPANDLLIKSSIDGVIFYSKEKNSIEVQKLYVVQGSVDYSTGNINVKSSVEIRGDVKPGFSVTTPYNIQIKGTVEHAVIACDCDLTVQGGIIGDGKNLIRSGGDVRAGYINNQIIKSGGNVFAATEIRNSFIESNKEVSTLKNNGVIIGGKISAANKISAATIGNKYNVPTEIEVGVNFSFKEIYQVKELEKITLQKMIDNLKKNISQITDQPQTSAANPRLLNFQKELEASSEKLDRVRKELKDIEKFYYDVDNPVVCVSNIVYPGTLIKIKHKTYEVTDELSHMMFKLVNDEINCSPLK